MAAHGGAERLLADCEAVAATAGDNYLPLLWRRYRSQRRVLLRFALALRFAATSHEDSLLRTLAVLLAHQESRGARLPVPPDGVDLSFASAAWRRLVLVQSAAASGPNRPPSAWRREARLGPAP
jgi:hypothetical protein